MRVQARGEDFTHPHPDPSILCFSRSCPLCLVQSSSTSREEEEDDLAPIVPSSRRRASKRAAAASLSNPPVMQAARKGSSRGGGNKVGDEESIGSRRRSVSEGAPSFVATPHPGQLGRHAGSNSLSASSTRKEAALAQPVSSSSSSGLTSSNRARKKLAPSSAQKRKSVMEASGGGGGSKKASAKEYVASRVWKNESTLTFGMRLKLAEHPCMWADAQFAATNLVDVFDHYDANSNDTLDKSEVAQLASDVVERYIMLYTEQLRRDQPSLSDSAVQGMLKRDLWPHLLPGANLVECKRLVAERLYRELDLDRDGAITKMEFMFQWKQTSKQWLTIRPPKGGLGCVIL